MQKSEAEQYIRHFCHEWAEIKKIPIGYRRSETEESLNFYEFKNWVKTNKGTSYFNFCSVMGADRDAEDWFNDVFKLRSLE